ncbi:MAG: transcriptional coactivator p15/PC4 family protein [Elusimicrobia bacterium]|nr:transcriptional coactivator p15/PC4 family protein [Elusimicrobiota bacterium]
MAEGKEFKPLKELGAIAVSEETEIKFYVDEYRGYPYASIRTFLKRSGYTGPTKAGITLNSATLDGVIATLSKLPAQPQQLADQELARFPRRPGTELVVRITIYKDTTGIDLREWVEDSTYKGWSKKGVRIPYPGLPKALEYLKGMKDFLANAVKK